MFEYWVVDVKARKLIVYRFPQSGDYQETRELLSEAKISPLAFPDVEIAIKDIFLI
ncbi:Uma2 family endonuclease [Gloeothece verrucosa]|uniref:Uma2 family endonuclease n=1 Tax=Gloeothece verrucosa TaxID=2546359 RepID=UPI000A05ED39